jgi:hypothetical protein
MEEISGDMRELLVGCTAMEGRRELLRGQSATWRLVRGPEEFYTWGGYYTQNHLGAVVLAAQLIPQDAGMRHWRLRTRMAGSVLITVNGTPVFETGIRSATIMEGQEDTEYHFEAVLMWVRTRYVWDCCALGAWREWVFGWIWMGQ